MTNEVLFEETNHGLATLTLNRPKALHSLNSNMLNIIKDKITEWEKRDDIKLILLQSSTERAFCAGGDMKSIYEAKGDESALKQIDDFFTLEYHVDKLMNDFKKPIVTILDGVVMGGGVGLSYGASHRVVTDTTKWAMPEMNIGFFPDIGSGYFLNQAPGHVGVYLALTGSIISGADAIYINCADYFIKQSEIESLREQISKTDWLAQDVDEQLATLMEKFAETPPTSELEHLRHMIDEYFHHETVEGVEGIVSALEQDSSDFAKQTKDILLSKSAVSLKVAHKHLQNHKNTSVHACLDDDLKLAKNFIRHDDFYEGVRSVLIDKDKKPNYEYKQLVDVSDEFLESFFK